MIALRVGTVDDEFELLLGELLHLVFDLQGGV
jgi:hypothetical protein